jgi:hypothetical protein
VERFIYSLSVSNNYKNELFEAYQYYTNAYAIPYKKPKKLRVESFVIQNYLCTIHLEAIIPHLFLLVF